ncbi:MAG: hypothetical protein IJ626_01940 [Muribaculaceae bacterium]|nr:hypothetical protein [Muribaculaceae bacterium]
MKSFQSFLSMLFIYAIAFAMSACNDNKLLTPEEDINSIARAEGVSSTPLSVISSMTQQQATVSKTTEDGYTVWNCTTTGTDPRVYFTTASRNVAIPQNQCILSFEYKTTTGIDGALQFFFGKVRYNFSSYSAYFTNNDMESQSIRFFGYDKVVSEWTKVEINVTDHRAFCNNWGVSTPGSMYYWSIWVDLGTASGKNFKIRNMQFRSLTAEEQAIQDEKDRFQADKLAFIDRVNNYLDTSFPSAVQNVKVTTDEVIVSGKAVGSGRFALAEITPYEDVTEFETYPHLTAIRGSQFSIRLSRYVERDGFTYDRLFSKWAIISLEDNKQTLASHARYADEVAAKRSPSPVLTPRNKKGVLGMGIHKVDGVTNDYDEFNCGISTVSGHINQWLMTKPIATTFTGVSPQPAIEHKYGGKTYYISGAAVADNDIKLRTMNQRGDLVFTYIEIWPLGSGSQTFDPDISPIIYHPERDGGNQLFPNLTTPEAFNAYAAFLEFFADRYTQDGQRIHHWVAYNEVNAPSSWANMGQNQPEMYFTDAYMKSMHFIYNVVRQYDQNASVSPCFTHNWALGKDGENEYAAVSMISNIKRYEAAEGEIFWGICHHPYPVTSAPDFWNYDPSYVNFTQNTPYITFYNLEVLADWANNPENYYHGKKRPIYLLEQGVNSRSNSTDDQHLQAAGIAWVWKKVNAIDGIDGIAYYAWVDGNDGTLMLGLRRDAANGYAKKESWNVWKAAGSSNEDAVFQQYLSVCGLSDWSQVLH